MVILRIIIVVNNQFNVKYEYEVKRLFERAMYMHKKLL